MYYSGELCLQLLRVWIFIAILYSPSGEIQNKKAGPLQVRL